MPNCPPTYRLRFFFDYQSGGCLWSDNEAAYQQFDTGPLDAAIYDQQGNLRQKPKIELPDFIRQKVLKLDHLYAESLDWENPGGPSLWDNAQWDNFYAQTSSLHQEITVFLGADFEVIYQQV